MKLGNLAPLFFFITFYSLFCPGFPRFHSRDDEEEAFFTVKVLYFLNTIEEKNTLFTLKIFTFVTGETTSLLRAPEFFLTADNLYVNVPILNISYS